jgi:hypothetical protein
MREGPKMVSSRGELFRRDQAGETILEKHQSFQRRDVTA